MEILIVLALIGWISSLGKTEEQKRIEQKRLELEDLQRYDVLTG